MTAFIKVVSSNRRRYFGTTLYDEVTTSNDIDGLELRLSGGVVVKGNKASENEVLESANIKAGQKIKIDFGHMKPVNYHADVAVNPKLFDVLTPTIAFFRVPPETTQELSIEFTAKKAVNLTELDTHIISLYLLE